MGCQTVRLIHLLHLQAPKLCFRYRILAELMDQGTRAGLVIPFHKPSTTTSTTSQNTARAIGVPELDMARTLGVNPSHALQHSGFYYYMAAKCTEMRRARFLAALEAEVFQFLFFFPRPQLKSFHSKTTIRLHCRLDSQTRRKSIISAWSSR